MIKLYFLILFFSSLSAHTLLTDTEKQYLSSIDSIKICSTQNNMPFEDFDKKNKHIGMVSSYFDIFQKELGLSIEVLQTSTPQESLILLKEKKCDAISISPLVNTSNEKLLYTDAYIVSPIVIAIKSPIPFITDFYNLKDKELLIAKNASYKQQLLNTYSNINKLKEILSTRVALHDVEEGKTFGAVGTLAEIGYYFYQDYMGELKIAGKTDLVDLKLSMVFRDDDKKLYLLFNKVINNLEKSIHYDIVSKWTSISYGVGIPSKVIYISCLFCIYYNYFVYFYTEKKSTASS